MSFELTVEYTSLPADLKTKWEEAFRVAGFDVEICPGFDPATWEGGFVPMRLVRAPEELIGMPLPSDGVSGFELWIDEHAADFRSSAGSSTTEFAMQCIGAALLAGLTSGTYRDPQQGESHTGADALAAAKREIEEFLAYATEQERVHHPFLGWASLGVDSKFL